VVDAEYTDQDHQFRESDEYARAKYDITLRWLGNPANGRFRLLNIGCGAGLFNELAHRAGYSVEACEPDPVAYASAAESAPDGVTVHRAGLFDAPFVPGAHVVVMHDVLEHIEDEVAAIEAIRQAVAPGGRVIISVPALQSLFGFHDQRLGHFRRYNHRSLRAALEGSFRIERMRYVGLSLIPVTVLYSRLLRRPYPTGAATDSSLISRVFAVLCRAEARIPMPIGTSVMCEATRTR
jgi:2-polyprenyl-3-methyl-5-hydroxy-6-metoxy-1,4-benzoquinol methylase